MVNQPAADLLHQPTRVAIDPVRRTIGVIRVEDLTPAYRRITFQAETLKTFQSFGFDDHIKAFFPTTDEAGEPTMAKRDFTPRRMDAANGLLTIDFALHDTGPATTWARQATPGATLEIAGPRGSNVIPDDFDWYLMIGDATALPAIGRRLEMLRPGVPVTTIITLAGERERLRFDTVAAWNAIWLDRGLGESADAMAIQNVIDRMTFPPGDGHLWIASESTVVRTLRNYLIEERRHPPQWLKAAGYWKRGQPGAHEKI